MSVAKKPLVMIQRKYIDQYGNVALWDLIGEPTGEKDAKTGAALTDGPVQIVRTGILAREALNRDPERYVLTLPKGSKPGPAQIEAEERARDEADEANAERNADPVYGQGALR